MHRFPLLFMVACAACGSGDDAGGAGGDALLFLPPVPATSGGDGGGGGSDGAGGSAIDEFPDSLTWKIIGFSETTAHAFIRFYSNAPGTFDIVPGVTNVDCQDTMGDEYLRCDCSQAIVLDVPDASETFIPETPTAWISRPVGPGHFFADGEAEASCSGIVSTGVCPGSWTTGECDPGTTGQIQVGGYEPRRGLRGNFAFPMYSSGPNGELSFEVSGSFTISEHSLRGAYDFAYEMP